MFVFGHAYRLNSSLLFSLSLSLSLYGFPLISQINERRKCDEKEEEEQRENELINVFATSVGIVVLRIEFRVETVGFDLEWIEEKDPVDFRLSSIDFVRRSKGNVRDEEDFL